MPRSYSSPLFAIALAAVLPACVLAQSSTRANERSTERSIERMAESIAAAAERMAARVEKHATIMADRIEREFDRKRRSGAYEHWDDDDFQEGRTRIDTTFAFADDGTIDLSLIAGDIIVTGWSRGEAHIKASSDRGRLELDVSSSRVTLEERGRGSMWGSRRGNDSRYEVCLPRGARVIARSTSGDVVIRGTGGAVEANSTSGDVMVEDATRRVELSSVSGDVSARKVRGTIDVSSVSGTIELDDVEGELHANTTSGDIQLGHVVSRDIEASTTSGDITFSGSISGDGRYEFNSHSGNIELAIPSSANARFAVETYSGELDSDFPITLQPGDRSLRRPRRFEFTVGSGGPRIVAETFSGDLQIRKR
ncbi:MAG: DUF4097 family beta strand repeat protein [Gemmatimonadaceae bacterium]|nr:DUF4097 family beta strand repeat protein [Gemmatimonadaceae bacterium]